ncbi:MAG TPA: neutral/alkaline non-lysosomal ceramidase N-terminal domain-containing protein, partial [Catenuloplanes sp.]
MRSKRSGIRALTLALVGAGLIVAGPPAAPSSAQQLAPGRYLVGTGIADITGEAAEVGMMGYAALDQKATGIHQRLRARAFVFADQDSGKRVAIVNTDTQSIMQSIQQGVVARLKARFGDRYTERNVLLGATHTHGGPGGYSHYALYNLTVLGY